MRVIINGYFLSKTTSRACIFGYKIINSIVELIKLHDESVMGIEFFLARPNSKSVEFSPILPEIRQGFLKGKLWEQFELPRIAGDDIILNLCGSAPVAGRNNIVFVNQNNIHGLNNSSYYRFTKFRNFIIHQTIINSACWISSSKYLSDKIIGFGVADRPPDAIICPEDSIKNSCENINNSNKYFPTIFKDPYILCFSREKNNKDIKIVERIASSIKKNGLNIVIVGDNNGKFLGDIPKTEPGIVRLGRVSDTALSALYQHARVFLAPSLFDHDSLACIEAMKFGCPVIISESSVLSEILGNAAITLDPSDTDSWISSIINIHKNKSLRNEIVSNGILQSAGFSWMRSAQQVAELIRSMP